MSAVVTLAMLTACGTQDVALDGPAPNDTDRDACRQLVRALPAEVADQPARTVDPDDGWGAAWGDPAIVLTCGSTPPRGFDRTSTCTTVNGVDWYLPEEQLSEGQEEVTLWTVNRAQHVRVLLPADYWPPATALADLATPVSRSLQRTGRCV